MTVTAEAGASTSVTMNPVPPGLEVTGTVIDASTDAGIVGAWVEASGDGGFEQVETGAGGTYALELQPGWYDFSASAEGYTTEVVSFEVMEGQTAVPAIELTPLAPGIHVAVNDDTFGGPAAGVDVALQPVAGGPTTVLSTDENGEVAFTGLANGGYTLTAVPGAGYQAGEPVEVLYAGGVEYVELSVEVDFSCEPAVAATGLTNIGFETGLDGWTLGYRAESITAVGADDFTSPWEGTSMARLGQSQPSDEEDQPEGPNIMCQDFVVDQAQETFAFNAFTYDYTGFDEFKFDVVVSNPARARPWRPTSRARGVRARS